MRESWTAAGLGAAFSAGRLSPVEVATEALARIERLNGPVNAYVFVDAEGALESARASEARWRAGAPLSPLDGVPASVKELLPATGWPWRRCSRAAVPEEIAREDAPAVARLREAGATLLGMTNSPEFGWKGVTDNLVFGATANPWDHARTAGGSSGGAAAAAALDLGVLHIGTDGGGSIRIPAAFCGVFGFKPTFGRAPVYPPSRFGTTSHVGPITRSAADAAHMLNALCRPDDRDWRSRPYDGRDYLEGLDDGVAGVRVAYSPTLGFAEVDPQVAERVAGAARALEAAGAHVEQVDTVMDDPTDMFRMIWASCVALTIAAFPQAARADMDPGLVALADYGARLDHMEYVQTEYVRSLLGGAMNAFHRDHDLLLTPTVPVTAFALGEQVAKPGQRDWMDWTPFTFPFNLTGQPAATTPCGLTDEGLPVGAQIVGPLDGDHLVLRACAALERVLPAPAPPQ